MDGQEGLQPGRQLDGRYVLQRQLGAGGMGTAFLAHDERLKRLVVIKLPHFALIQETGFRERFFAEIRNLTALDHPNIVKVYDSGTDSGRPFVVVQYLGGGSLGDRIKSGGTLEPEEIKGWLPYVASALDFVHSQGIIHRDVKPDNVLFDEFQRVYVSDFGISKALSSETETSVEQTSTGMFLGSPEYVPPEFVDRRFTPAFDQYSLGVLLYRALSGLGPHQAATAERLLIEKCSKPPVPLIDRVPDLPLPLTRVVMRALEREPERRFPTCRELAEAFEQGGFADDPDATKEWGAVAAGDPNAERRSGRRGLLALLILLVALAGVGSWAWREGWVADGTAPLLDADATLPAGPVEPTEPPVSAPLVAGLGPPPEPVTGLPPPEPALAPTPAPPSPPVVSTLEFHSSVRDAIVFIDGKVAGAPGTTRYPVEPGRHQVRIEHAGYVSIDREIDVGEGANQRVELKLARRQADPAPPAPVPPTQRERTAGMVGVGAGEFFFGCNADVDQDCTSAEGPGRISTLPAFEIDRTEVTVESYRLCVEDGACSDGRLSEVVRDGTVDPSWSFACNWRKSGRRRHPINCLDWSQASSYCRWRGARLPTEMEWEKAARGREGTKYPWGNSGGRPPETKLANIVDETARKRHPEWENPSGYDDGYYTTAPVGSYPAGASPYDALDMAGNVWEWTSGWYGGARRERVVRGGSWFNYAKTVRTSSRHRFTPNSRAPEIGFRCVR